MKPEVWVYCRCCSNSQIKFINLWNWCNHDSLFLSTVVQFSVVIRCRILRYVSNLSLFLFFGHVVIGFLYTRAFISCTLAPLSPHLFRMHWPNPDRCVMHRNPQRDRNSDPFLVSSLVSQRRSLVDRIEELCPALGPSRHMQSWDEFGAPNLWFF